MKKLRLLIAASLLTAGGVSAQVSSISGSIRDGGQQSVIDAATVSLLNFRDSSLVKTSITDKDGNFSFDRISAGTYLVMATSIGHSKVYSDRIETDSIQADKVIPTLQLVPIQKSMAEVVVKTKKPFIERQIDKIIVNPDALISNTGSTAMEVLEKAPGVSVDKDGNISLKGRQGVIILIDGKQTYMGGEDLANFLRNLPASSLEVLEVMTNPSSKYDASGNSGLINIRTKKNKQKGFNGSLSTSYGQGRYAKTNNSLNLNYRNGKVNLFSTLSGNYRKNYQNLDIWRKYTNADKTLRADFSQNTTKLRESHFYNAKVGMDFYATKRTTLGVIFTGYYSPSLDRGDSYSYPKNNVGHLDSIVAAIRREDGLWKNGGVNLNFQHNFDSSGRQLTADVDFLQYTSNRHQSFDNVIYNTDWTTRYADVLFGELPSDIKIYSAKTDYLQTVGKGIKFETGLKFSYVTTDNTAAYDNVINGVRSIDIKKTNRFQYRENVNAAYVNFSKKIKKWGLQAGLRIENTNYNGHQFGNEFRPGADSTFQRSYTNAFPTAYVSYHANEKNEYGFSFGRRVERPDYEDLNPFLFFLDKYTYEEGNPFLRPMYSNVIELSHTYNQFLTTSLNYTHTKDLFNEVFRQNNDVDDSIATIVSKGNYGINNNISLSVNAQFKIAKWWSSMFYVEGRYQEYKGELNGEMLDAKGYALVGNMNQQFSFKKGWGAEVSGFMRSRVLEGQLIIRPMSQVDLGVKKDILKGKGSIKLSVRDVYGPRVVKGNINFQNTQASFRQNNDSRVATVSFNYRFGKPIKGTPKRKTGGAGEEQNRVKSGG